MGFGLCFWLRGWYSLFLPLPPLFIFYVMHVSVAVMSLVSVSRFLLPLIRLVRIPTHSQPIVENRTQPQPPSHHPITSGTRNPFRPPLQSSPKPHFSFMFIHTFIYPQPNPPSKALYTCKTKSSCCVIVSFSESVFLCFFLSSTI